MNNNGRSKLVDFLVASAIVILFILLSSEAAINFLADTLMGDLPEWLVLACIPGIPAALAVFIYVVIRRTNED